MERVAILFNPSSGQGQAQKYRAKLEAKLKRQGINYELIVSRHLEHFKECARQAAAAFPVVLAAGGDSTFYFLVNEVLRSPSNRPVIGMIGLGSCNDLSRALGQWTPQHVLNAVASKRYRAIDIGVIRHHGDVAAFFPGQVSLGLGVSLNMEIAALQSRFRPFRQWQTVSGLYAGWRVMTTTPPQQLRIVADERCLEGRFRLFVCSNISYYAGGKRALPAAVPDDGELDAFTIAECSFGRMAYLTALSVQGRHLAQKEVSYVRASHFTIQADEPFLMQADGEIVVYQGELLCAREIEIDVLPGALTVIG